MTATRYTAAGKREAATRRAAQLENRRRAIAASTFEEFLVEFVGYPSADRCPPALVDDYRVEWDAARADYPVAS